MQQAQREREAQELQQLKSAKIAKQTEIDAIAKRRDTIQGEAATKIGGDMQARWTAIFNDEKLGFGGKLMAFVGVLSGATLGFIFDTKALLNAAELSPMFAFALIGLWAGLVSYVESGSRIVKILIGTMHAAAHIATLLFISWLASATGVVPRFLGAIGGVSDDITPILWNILVALFVGGLLGGFVMGLYWTLTSTLFNMHTGDAFGALGTCLSP